MKAGLRVTGMLLALAAAAVLALAAVDIGALKRTIAADDAQFMVRPARPDWTMPGILPGNGVASLMAVQDDLAYRRAMRHVVKLREKQNVASGSLLSVLLASAEGALLDEASEDPDPRRRSQALNLLGALTLIGPISSRDSASLSSHADRFQEAVALDPTNERAKENLEIAYRLLRAQGVEEHEADEGEEEGASAGAGLGGQGGSGY